MYDFAFGKRSLRREFLRSDFAGNAGLLDDAVQEDIINTAVSRASNGFPAITFAVSDLRGKPVYQTAALPDDLVLRKLSKNIRAITKVRQADRNEIVKSLTYLLQEGHAYRVYKLDIKQFYESLRLPEIEQRFSTDPGFPASSLFVLRSFGLCLNRANIPGLPRGLSISATLAEYAMRAFDLAVRRQDTVYFYARFVDDIIIVTTGKEDKHQFRRLLHSLLPEGLNFNHGKSYVCELFAPKVTGAGAPAVELTVDFLGYRFHISKPYQPNSSIIRDVRIDIAPRKVTRFKSRLCLSLLRFGNDGRFDDLFERFKLLTGNYNLYDYDKSLRRNVGIYWNYRHINSEQSTALPELDSFLRAIVLNRAGRIAGAATPRLSTQMRNQLLSLSFARSFKRRTHHHFNAGRLASLVECWKYE
ncbi:MAG: antiviral reverse transcriptase Drt3a [Mesorhizobium sp.]